MTKQPTDGLDYNTYFYDPLVSIMIRAARLHSCSEGSRIAQLPVFYVCRIHMYAEEVGGGGWRSRTSSCIHFVC